MLTDTSRHRALKCKTALIHVPSPLINWSKSAIDRIKNYVQR